MESVIDQAVEGTDIDNNDVLSGVQVQDWLMLVFEGTLFLAPLLLGPLFVMLYRLYLYYKSHGYKYEEHLIKGVTTICERPFYNYLYASGYNGTPSHKVYELNFKYNNIYDCRVCLHEFETGQHKEDILHCGHRFHKKCLRAWELQQLHVMQLQGIYFKPYQCPMCRTDYHWKQKWDDEIGHYVRMHHRLAAQKGKTEDTPGGDGSGSGNGDADQKKEAKMKANSADEGDVIEGDK